MDLCKKIAECDMAKSIGIILVIIGHNIVTDGLKRFIIFVSHTLIFIYKWLCVSSKNIIKI